LVWAVLVLTDRTHFIAKKDVGAGNGPDGTEQSTASLSNIPLRWMIKEILEADPGIIFTKDGRLQSLGIHPNAVVAKEASADAKSLASENSQTALLNGDDDSKPSPFVDPNVHEADILCDTHDQLRAQPLWWLLELVPFLVSRQNERDEWVTYPR
jgi:hypothetical protein